MSKLETNTIDTVSGTSTLQVGSTNTSTITLGVSGDTINVPSGVTINNNGTQTGFGGNMAPAFHAYLGANMEGLSDGATTRINCNTEIFDTNNAYDNSSNYRFTPQTSAKYFVYGQVMVDSDATANLVDMDFEIRKNNSTIGKATMNFSNNNIRIATLNTQAVVSMNGSSDYLDIYVYVNTGDSGNYKIIADSTQQRTYFGAYKIIE